MRVTLLGIARFQFAVLPVPTRNSVASALTRLMQPGAPNGAMFKGNGPKAAAVLLRPVSMMAALSGRLAATALNLWPRRGALPGGATRLAMPPEPAHPGPKEP